MNARTDHWELKKEQSAQLVKKRTTTSQREISMSDPQRPAKTPDTDNAVAAQAAGAAARHGATCRAPISIDAPWHRE